MDALSRRGRRSGPTLVLRRRVPARSEPAVWYIVHAGRLTNTGCEAHERPAAEAVLARYCDRLLISIAGPVAEPPSTMKALIQEHFERTQGPVPPRIRRSGCAQRTCHANRKGPHA